MNAPLKSPYTYFGGKRKVAAEIWARFGQVNNYVEPFFGSGAVLLGRPEFHTGARWIETVNDLDGFIANFWRSMRADPETTAWHADNPVIEADLEARHGWLIQQRGNLTEKLQDPDYYDAKIAGWWVWGMSAWIGSGWCSGRGPWEWHDGRLVDTRQLPHLGDAGRGIWRQLPHIGSAGRGICRRLPHLGNAGQGINRNDNSLQNYFRALSARMGNVRVCCGDWSRVCGPAVTHNHGTTAVLLDPPYSDTAGRDPRVYAMDCLRVAYDVRDWAIANGGNPLMRIALCGYEGEHDMPGDWSVFACDAGAGFGSQARERTGNGKRERIWFSPHCLDSTQDIFSTDWSAA